MIYCSFYLHIFKRMHCIYLHIFLSLATHTQLEAQLSDAFKEDVEDEAGFISLSVNSTNSDSDSDEEEGPRKEGGVMSPDTPPIREHLNPLSSLETSIISIDLGASSIMMHSSVMDVEVRNGLIFCCNGCIVCCNRCIVCCMDQ